MPLRERDTSTVQAAADAFLSSPRYANPTTRRGYTGVLDRLLAALRPSRPLAEVSGEELAPLLGRPPRRGPPRGGRQRGTRGGRAPGPLAAPPHPRPPGRAGVRLRAPPRPCPPPRSQGPVPGDTTGPARL